MEYGGTIEFEADTNWTDNTDETWVFLSGGWGEVRLGDEDGVADNSSVGQVIAAGTGGIDGSDAVISAALVYLTNSNDATKIRYYTPSFGGFSVGVDYTPTARTSTAAPTTAVPSPSRTATSRWTPRTSSRAACRPTASSAAPRSWPRWWACTAS